MKYNQVHKRFLFIPVVVVGVVGLLILIVVSIYDVNHRFPASTETLQYNENVPANENGLIITPKDVKICSIDEYNEAFPEITKYDYINEKYADEKNQWKIVVYTLLYHNDTDHTLNFEADSFDAEARHSGWFNGVLCDNSNSKNTIDAGATIEIRVSGIIYSKSMLSGDWINHLHEDEYILVYKRYPVKKELLFNLDD